jgi:prophage regulatory protein
MAGSLSGTESFFFRVCGAAREGELQAVKMLRWYEVRERTGLSRSTIWRLEGSGMFPRRRQLGGNSVGWVEAEIQEWLERRPFAVVGGGEDQEVGDDDNED